MRDALAAIVGPNWVKERRQELAAFDSDGLPGYRITPSLAVLPANRNELIEVVRTLAKAGTPFVPRGAGTGLSGGALANETVLIGLNRINSILEIDPVNRLARVEPGVVNARLTQAAARFNLHYAPDPSSQTVCTIGGNVAENAGGPHCLKYGVTLNHILECEVLLPDGSLVTLGSATSDCNGLDLLGPFVGSEGCFGIATEITVRLTPVAESVHTLLADFASVDAAARAVSAIIATGIVPAALEMMDHAAINAVEASIYAAGYPTDAAAILLCEVDGIAQGLAEDVAIIRQACTAAGARSIRTATDAADRLRLWQGRKKTFGAMGRIAPSLVVQDAVVPRTRLPEVLASIEQIGRNHGVHVCNVFHAGDGNLHPNIPYNSANAEESRRVHEAMSEIMQACIDAGGTITGEHGVGIDKMPYMTRLFDVESLTAMRSVKSVFDPTNRANPGKVLPADDHDNHHSRRTVSDGSAPVSSGAAAAAPSAHTSPVEKATSPQRIAEIIQHARHSRTPLRIAGSATWLEGGGPFAHGITMNMASLSGITEYTPGDLVISAHAGTTLAEISETTARHGQMLAIAPYGSPNSSIGAIVATASESPLAFDELTVRDLILGCTVVTGTGAITKAGGRVVKNVAGFDLVRLHTGAWGTLGPITEVCLRLHAIPEMDMVLESALDDNWEATVHRLIQSHVNTPMLVVGNSNQPPRLLVRMYGNNARVAELRSRISALGVVNAVEIDKQHLRNLRGGIASATDGSQEAVIRMRSAPSDAVPLLRAARELLPLANFHFNPRKGSLRATSPMISSHDSFATSLERRFSELGGVHKPSVIFDQGRQQAPARNRLEAGIKSEFDPDDICNRLVADT